MGLAIAAALIKRYDEEYVNELQQIEAALGEEHLVRLLLPLQVLEMSSTSLLSPLCFHAQLNKSLLCSLITRNLSSR